LSKEASEMSHNRPSEEVPVVAFTRVSPECST
jgi:hypothetical protein